jgi:hypothetical protein
MHRVLEVRGRKIEGAGAEWFKTTVNELLAIHEFIISNGQMLSDQK